MGFIRHARRHETLIKLLYKAMLGHIWVHFENVANIKVDNKYHVIIKAILFMLNSKDNAE